MPKHEWRKNDEIRMTKSWWIFGFFRHSCFVHSSLSNPLLGRGESFGIDLVEHAELGDLHGDEVLAVALAVDLRRLVHAAEFLVVSQGGLLRELLAHETDHLGDLLDRPAALLVEIDREVLAVRSRRLQSDRGLAADLLFARRLDLEAVAFQHSRRHRR